MLQYFPKENVFLASWACKRGWKRSPLTLNGEPGYEPGCQFHALSRESVFSFLAVQCNSFFFENLSSVGFEPTTSRLDLPLLHWLSYEPSFSFLVNKVLLHCCVADKMHSVCQKQHFSFSQISTHVSMTWLKHGTCFPFMYYTLTANTSKNIFALKTLERLSLS